MIVFIDYLIIINIISFILVYIDKRKAIKKKYRIKEKTLFFLIIIGGCFGFTIGMFLFHHKNRKMKFKIISFFFDVIWLIISFKVVK